MFWLLECALSEKENNSKIMMVLHSTPLYRGFFSSSAVVSRVLAFKEIYKYQGLLISTKSQTCYSVSLCSQLQTSSDIWAFNVDVLQLCSGFCFFFNFSLQPCPSPLSPILHEKLNPDFCFPASNITGPSWTVGKKLIILHPFPPKSQQF